MTKQCKMMRNGTFVSGGEAMFVEIPCRVFSTTGEWYADCVRHGELYAALKRHHAEIQSMFDLDTTWEWLKERPGDVYYTALQSPRKHNTRGILDEGFLIF